VYSTLGHPDREEVAGGGQLLGYPVAVTKIANYDALGLRIHFEKKKVAGITKLAGREISFWQWVLNKFGTR
jgi:hypothetical protein